ASRSAITRQRPGTWRAFWLGAPYWSPVITCLVGGRHGVARDAEPVHERGQGALPQRCGVGGRSTDRCLQVDRDRLTGHISHRHRALHSALHRLLLDLGRGMQRGLLIAQLVLLRDELALLILETRDVIRR